MATSELNQFLENVDEKVLECTICFKRLQNPKSLSCLHSFCLACLQDWVKAKGKLICPTCSKSHPIPEGGLQKLPPNTFLNNLLETIQQFSEKDGMECACKKGEAALYYCQDCRQYLCSTCIDHHKDFRLFENHKLHSVEYMQSMSPIQKASLHPPQCLLHNKPFEFYCVNCTIPICVNCTIMNHKEWEGKHKPISISEAFKTFKNTFATLEKDASGYEKKLQDSLKAVIQNSIKLKQSKETSLRDIDNHVKEIVKIISENGDKLKNKVETIYTKKMKENDVQMDELKTAISDINTKLSFLNQLLKSDEATAMQSSERVITALKDRINELPKTVPDDNGKIKFFKKNIATLQDYSIGYVKEMKAANCLILLKEEEFVTEDQTIVVKIIKTDECEIHANQLKATWTQPTGKTIITQIHKDNNGDYFVTGKCTNPVVCKLDVSADGTSIKQSPMIIKVQKRLVNTIQINHINIRDLVKSEDDCLLVSCLTNEILKYKQSGEYIGKITLPQCVKVNRMYKMKNGNIVFSDCGDKCVKVCNMNGMVIKSIGQQVLQEPTGIHVDESSKVVYVSDIDGLFGPDNVFIFEIYCGCMIRKIEPLANQGGELYGIIDVTFTNQRDLLVLEYNNSRLQLFDNEGRFMKVLVKAGYENDMLRNPRGVVVDKDDNIIISSNQKLQLFSRDGNFIKRIDKPEDEIKTPWGLCIISYHPRRVAVVNKGNKSIKIFNY
ncbi:E3 ubiquitin-protein ligase TRIM71-like [Anneissia japonica]|uniref:E3 ubiquitin-protein ligase TRIM71-like n=1 Tax=Anneissia japonica TaxID=1529436 RepID=UPI00142550EB|nr:E3 ubiquitin-protein ligase TRIM71-like [Anneissia japonica]